jgi:hypothetical protein
VEGIKYLTPEKSMSMRRSCEKRAKIFGLEEFKKKLKNLLN